MRMSPEKTQSVYQKIDIDWEYLRDAIPIKDVFELVGVDVDSKNKANCIAHADKNPSMVINPKKNRCRCFSCGFFGSPIDVVMQTQNLTSRDAAVYLSENFGGGVTILEEKQDDFPKPPYFTPAQYKMLGLKANPFQQHSVKNRLTESTSKQESYLLTQQEAATLVLDKINEYIKDWQRYLQGILQKFPELDVETIEYMSSVIKKDIDIGETMREMMQDYLLEIHEYLDEYYKDYLEEKEP